jgi:hypothetical protein
VTLYAGRAVRGETRPVVTVRGAGSVRVSIIGVVCYRPGDRPCLFYQLLVYHRRRASPGLHLERLPRPDYHRLAPAVGPLLVVLG